MSAPLLKLVRVGQLGPPLELPSYQSGAAVGLDLRADEACALLPGERRLVPTGLALELQPGTKVAGRARGSP